MSKLLTGILIMIAVAASGLGISAVPQSTIPQTPYHQWTFKEAQELLSNSPWAQTRDKGIPLGGLETNLPAAPEVMVLRLRSALPIRQALARIREIKSKYDGLKDSDKKAIDQKNKILLECPPCPDTYVVTLAGGGPNGKGLPTIFLTISEAEVRANVQI